ncbi:MAG: MFS transporter [Candidatus Absconditabacteria bacterium]
MSKIKIIALLTIFLDILGFTIMIPAMPGLANDYHVAYTMITLGSALYALFGIFSTPMLGGRSDKIGRKPVMLISMIGSMLAYFSIAISHNIWMYIVGMVINGITAGNIGTAQSILSDISKDKKERMTNLGLFGMIFGVGFIIGPVIGALTLKFGNHGPFRAAGILALINITSAIFFLKETHTKREEHSDIKLNIYHIFKDIVVGKERIYYLIYFLINLGIMIYQSTYLLYLDKNFNLPGSKGGFIMGAYGLIMIFNQAVLFKKVWLKLPTKTLVYISFIGFIVCYLGAFLFPFKRAVILLIGVTTLFQGIFRPVFQNIILGENKNVGLINGNMLNLMNMANIFGPLIGGALLDSNISPFALSATAIAVAFFIYTRITEHRSHSIGK